MTTGKNFKGKIELKNSYYFFRIIDKIVKSERVNNFTLVINGDTLFICGVFGRKSYSNGAYFITIKGVISRCKEPFSIVFNCDDFVEVIKNISEKGKKIRKSVEGKRGLIIEFLEKGITYQTRNGKEHFLKGEIKEKVEDIIKIYEFHNKKERNKINLSLEVFTIIAEEIALGTVSTFELGKDLLIIKMMEWDYSSEAYIRDTHCNNFSIKGEWLFDVDNDVFIFSKRFLDEIDDQEDITILLSKNNYMRFNASLKEFEGEILIITEMKV